MEENNSTKKKPGLLEYLGPKKAFWYGMIVAVLAVGTLGFLTLIFFGDVSTSSSLEGEVGAVVDPDDSKTDTNTPSVANVDTKPVTADDHIRGDFEQAEIAIIEFSDLECPFCKKFHETMKQVVADYNGKVAWVYRHFPLDSLHGKARKEAEATECAAELGGNDGFWQYTDRLYEITPSNNGLDLDKLPEIATEIGLNEDEFKTCLDSGRYKDKVADQLQDATNSGGRGTPHSVIVDGDGNATPVSGALPIEKLKSIIDPLLE